MPPTSLNWRTHEDNILSNVSELRRYWPNTFDLTGFRFDFFPRRSEVLKYGTLYGHTKTAEQRTVIQQYGD